MSIPELLAAVRANPDDDAARAVLADALVREGDPRGELVATCIARDTPDVAAHRTRLYEAEHARLARTYPGVTCSLANGLVITARFDVSALAVAVELLRAEPVNDVTIEGPFGIADAATLVRALDDGTPPALTIANYRANGNEHVGALLGAEAMRKVRSLTLDGHYLGEPALDALASSEWLVGLEALAIVDCGADDSWAARLAHGRERPLLARLDWLHNHLSWNGGAELLETLWAPITTLEIRQRVVNGPLERALRAPGLADLEELYVSGGQFAVAQVRALANTAALAKLRHLALGDLGAAVEALVASPHLSPDLVVYVTGDDVGMSRRYSTDETIVLGWDGEPTGPLTERFAVRVGGTIYPRRGRS